jgi:chromosome segregation ATPase
MEDTDTPLGLVLSQLRQINSEVRLIPRLQAEVENTRSSLHSLDTAIRETTARNVMQAEAHQGLINNLREQQQAMQLRNSEILAVMSGLSNDVAAVKNDLGARVLSLEKQIAAMFQQLQTFSRDLRDVDSSGGALSAHIDEWQDFKIELLPWLKTAKWVIIAGGGVLVAWLMKVLIEVVIKANVLP